MEKQINPTKEARNVENILLTTETLILLTIAVSCFATGETVQGWAFIIVIWVCSVGVRIQKIGGEE